MDRTEMLNRKVYRLCGADVGVVLEQLGRQDIIDSNTKLNSVIDYVATHLEIPWTDYVQECIEAGLDNDSIPEE